MMLLVLAALAGILGFLGLGKVGESVTGLFRADPKKQIAREIAENHEVAAQEAAAVTDGEADAALDAAARADRS